MMHRVTFIGSLFLVTAVLSVNAQEKQDQVQPAEEEMVVTAQLAPEAGKAVMYPVRVSTSSVISPPAQD